VWENPNRKPGMGRIFPKIVNIFDFSAFSNLLEGNYKLKEKRVYGAHTWTKPMDV